MAETAFEYLTDENYMWVSTSEKRMINKMTKMMRDHGEECQVIRWPEENWGYLYCRVPKNWIHIYAPKKRAMTEEQKKEVGDRLARSRQGTIQA